MVVDPLPAPSQHPADALVLRPDQLAGALQVGTRRAAELARELPHVALGPRCRRYPRTLVERWLEERALATAR